ncbi:MAG TPA: FRG domain-containing protein [Polyangiaceae bacterium]|nr:FRG domain-containing protein [Polyangiaceae bacterium]
MQFASSTNASTAMRRNAPSRAVLVRDMDCKSMKREHGNCNVSTTTAESWEHLQQLLFEGSWDPDLERFRSQFVFRGLDRADYALTTSLMRMGGRYLDIEGHMIRNLRKYASRVVVSRDSDWHWVTVGQHHGLPTRLLDWTYSPFVAMHFATANCRHFQSDGAIWMVHMTDAMALAPPAFQEALKSLGGYGLDLDHLPEVCDSLKSFSAAADSPFVIFFEPPSIDERIINQYAVFSALSDPGLSMDDWLLRPGCEGRVRYKKIVLPAKLKWEVRDKLDHANITERMLFPGLDGLCAWLRRYYGPKNPSQ